MGQRSRFYKGDPDLKASGVQNDFTPEQIKEYIRCSKNPKHFVQNWVKITHPDHGLVPFKMYPWQRNLVDLLNNERFVVAKLPRQSGKCSVKGTKIKIRNQHLGVERDISIGEFFELVKKLDS